MSELTDLEICKRIAEIECVKVSEVANNFLMRKDITFGLTVNISLEFARCKTLEDYRQVEADRERNLYNPLTDDALCFQLMVKYDCDLISPYRPNNDTHWECQIFTEDCADAVSVYDDSPNKAICLAIIEAHKDQS
jgi:hypothetical protein